MKSSLRSMCFILSIGGLAAAFWSPRALALADAVAKPYPPIIQGVFQTSSGTALTLDSLGNRYVVGTFTGSKDFNPGVGLDAKTATGAADVFVTRYNVDGSYAWTQTLNGAAGTNTSGYALAVSPDGLTVYAVGSFAGLIKIGGAGTGISPASGSTPVNAFIMALNTADGSAKAGFGTGGLQKFGGSNQDTAFAVTVTSTTLYVVGIFNSASSQIGGAGPTLSPSGQQGDAFIIALNPATGAAITTFGRNSSGIQNFGAAMSSQAVGYNCLVDGTTLYVTGYFTTPGPTAQIGISGPGVSSLGSQDTFVLALSASLGTGVAGFATGGIQTFGGTGSDFGCGLAVLNNSLFVAGGFTSTNAQISGSGSPIGATGGTSDVFVFALDKTKGTALTTFGISSTGIQTLGGTAYDNFGGMVVSSTTLYLAATSQSTNFKIGNSGPAVGVIGTNSAMVAALNAVSGTAVTTFGLASSGIQTFGGSGSETPYGLALNGANLSMLGTATSVNAGVGAVGGFDSTGFGAFLLNLDSSTGAFAQSPTAIALKPASITEGKPAGTTVGALTTTDPNPASTFTYTLVPGTGGTDNASFRIAGASLVSAAVFSAMTKSSYAIRVRSTNQSNLFFEAQLTVTVTPAPPVPPIAPTGVLLSNTSVPDQSAAGTLVGTLSVPNPDPNNSYKYTLNSPALGGTGTGGGGEDNAFFSISNNTVLLASPVDFNTKNTLSLRVQVTDSVARTNEGVFQINVVPQPNSGGQGVANVDNGVTVTNPVDNFSLSLVSSDGGVVQLHVDASALLGRSVLDISTVFGDIPGRASVVPGNDPAHRFASRGIFIAKATATDHATGIIMGMGRKTLVISAKEVGQVVPGARDTRGLTRALGDAPSNTLTARTIKGKFIFSATKSDSVDYVGTIALPSNLDVGQSHELSFAIGNIVVDAMLDGKGKGKAVGNAAVLKSLKLHYKGVKKGVPTKGGEIAQVSAVFSSAGLVDGGFDTEGISTRSTDIVAGKSGQRSIQVGMLLDGVPYSAPAPVTFAISKDSLFGTIQGRK